MPRIPLLAHMNISPQTVAFLRGRGWDIVRVSQLLPVNASDKEILQLARSQGRAVVTQDLDFSTLLALGGYREPSLITLRMSYSDPEKVSERLATILPAVENALEDGSAITVDDTTVRIRELPIRST